MCFMLYLTIVSLLNQFKYKRVISGSVRHTWRYVIIMDSQNCIKYFAINGENTITQCDILFAIETIGDVDGRT